MTVLSPGKTLRSREPLLLVENALAPGTWRFQLVVVDDEQNESAPVQLAVRVDAPAAPTPVRPLRPERVLNPTVLEVESLRPRRPVGPR